MAGAMTGSWQQQRQPKYPIHFCLRSMLATKLTDTPENTGKSFQQSKDTQLSQETDEPFQHDRQCNKTFRHTRKHERQNFKTKQAYATFSSHDRQNFPWGTKLSNQNQIQNPMGIRAEPGWEDVGVLLNPLHAPGRVMLSF